MPRFHCPATLVPGALLQLPAGTARHVQVLRLQPGGRITLFDGQGGEFDAVVEQMGRSDVSVRIGAHSAVEREATRAVHLAVGMPANDRMDWLVEKACELGVASIQPLLAERSVLRLTGERAARKQAHWQAIAVAACEQCGRNRIPMVHPLLGLGQWTASFPTPSASKLLLSLRANALPLAASMQREGPLLLLSGPEGGLSAAEEDAALAQGFTAVSLGARVLRAETAPLAVLAALTLGQ